MFLKENKVAILIFMIYIILFFKYVEKSFYINFHMKSNENSIILIDKINISIISLVILIQSLIFWYCLILENKIRIEFLGISCLLMIYILNILDKKVYLGILFEKISYKICDNKSIKIIDKKEKKIILRDGSEMMYEKLEKLEDIMKVF
jgi:hypothetical protein